MTTLCVNYKRKVTRFLKPIARRISGLARPAREKFFWKDPGFRMKLAKEWIEMKRLILFAQTIKRLACRCLFKVQLVLLAAA